MSTQNLVIDISTTSSRIMLSSKNTSIPLIPAKIAHILGARSLQLPCFLLYTFSHREITSSINTRTLENVHCNHFLSGTNYSKFIIISHEFHILRKFSSYRVNNFIFQLCTCSRMCLLLNWQTCKL